MTNEEKFKTPEEQYKEYQKYCAKYPNCKGCPLNENKLCDCQFTWLALESEEEKEEKQND